jgi:uncharacterized protein
MLADTVLAPDHCGVPCRGNRNEFRMRYLELAIARQHQRERFERPRLRELFEPVGIHGVDFADMSTAVNSQTLITHKLGVLEGIPALSVGVPLVRSRNLQANIETVSMNKFSLLTLVVAQLLAPLATAAADTKSAPAPAKQHFLYVLRLVPRLHDDKAWSPADEAVIGRHFNHLKAATDRGQVVIAGRTQESGDKTMGLVIFEAADESAARAFMDSDPAVAEKIMTAELHPYAIALRGK